MLLYLARRIRRRSGALRDPLTGKVSHVTLKGDSLEHIYYQVEGSQEVVEQVKAVLVV
jgi:hypothetical protein